MRAPSQQHAEFTFVSLACACCVVGGAGACGGECACSTCHVILDEKEYELLDEPDEEEEDMLDLALGLTDTYESLHLCLAWARCGGVDCRDLGVIACWEHSSRLGCQVFLSADLHGMRVTLPAETANFLDG